MCCADKAPEEVGSAAKDKVWQGANCISLAPDWRQSRISVQKVMNLAHP
jgi:hypothetical protein